MNILITGSKGLIGKELSKQLHERYGYNIYEINRENCDLLDYDSVYSFFTNNNVAYDLVLHTAIKGGRRTKEDENMIVYENLLMLYNLLSFQNYYQCIISFGSGAELDRRYDINPKARNRYPIDPYGLSKSIIDKLTIAEPKLCNFRIYNCFGINEQEGIMIRSNIEKYINKENIVIHQNRKMDFFYIDDLVSLINFFIDSNNIPKTFDCCYKQKTTLLDIANIINNLSDYKVEIILEEDRQQNINSSNKDYYGQFVDTHIDYIGLEQGIKIMYDHYIKENK
jgi:GDP-L-fucose synthase